MIHSGVIAKALSFLFKKTDLHFFPRRLSAIPCKYGRFDRKRLWAGSILTRAREGGRADFALPSCFSDISKNLRLDSYEILST